jgi:hypothetical protein
MRRYLAAVAVAVALLPVIHADACSCAQSPPQALAQRAEAVFTGTVQNISALSQMRTAYTFSVDLVYKGAVASQVVIYSNSGGPSCGAEFAPRTRYTVFATTNPQEGGLASSLCSGNTQGTIDPVAYGLPPGQAPRAAPSGPALAPSGSAPAPDYSWLWVPIAVLAGGSVVLLGVWVLLRRRVV